MTLLAIAAIAAVILGTGFAFGYSLGLTHGRENATSERWDELEQRRYRRCTPEPSRVRLLGAWVPVTDELIEDAHRQRKALGLDRSPFDQDAAR